jgi:hypothetical protein
MSNGPYRDPEEGDRKRSYRTPRILARLRRQYTYDRQLSDFKRIFGRSPQSDDELEAYVEEYLREVYNKGKDSI